MKHITTDDLRRMTSQEGLILQGCGGDLQEWVDGINEMLTEAGILEDGSIWKAENVSTFEKDECINLLFPFDGDIKLDIGKLAIWRLQTHEQFVGTWLSDYVPNSLGGFVQQPEQIESEKPFCPLIGQNGNIFNLMGIASKTLRENGLDGQSREMCQRIMGGNCHSYSEALNIIGEYVQITDSDSMRKHPKKKARNANER